MKLLHTWVYVQKPWLNTPSSGYFPLRGLMMDEPVYIGISDMSTVQHS